MVFSTIREILVQSEQKFGVEDAVRYKLKKDIYVVSMQKAESEDEKQTSCGSFCCRRRFCIVMPL